MRFVLASSSPRRREICERYGLEPVLIKPDLEEKQRDYEDPYATAMSLAFEKGQSVVGKLRDGDLVLASDTIIYFKGKKLGKPSSKEEALDILKEINNSSHKVITGISIIEVGSNRKIVDYVETLVFFKDNSLDKLRRYVDTEEPMDKAGGYGIQGLGQLLIDRIEGSYLNVVGLPIERISDLMEEYFQVEIL